MSSAIKKARRLRPKPNYLSAIISVALVLFVLGLFSVVSLHSGHLANYFKEKINIIVELGKNANDNDIQDIITFIKRREESIGETVEHVSKDKALELLKEDFGEDILLLDMPNPLFDVVLFNVKGAYLNSQFLFKMRTDIKNYSSKVSDVYYQESLINSVVDNVERVSYFLLILAVVFALISIVIIHNSIKLALYSNRKLIKNMELVGASWSFIRKPFIFKALLHGLISAVLAIVLLSGVLYYLYSNYPELINILDEKVLIYTVGGMVLIGLLLNFFSTYLVTTKYLKMRFDDLF